MQVDSVVGDVSLVGDISLGFRGKGTIVSPVSIKEALWTVSARLNWVVDEAHLIIIKHVVIYITKYIDIHDSSCSQVDDHFVI